ncbi:MAG: transglycosylase SLT domain-containing protein [Candidatus Electryonea clarkiae]|nr:transglycosylase SLT domain-containing protein [Candidatus Electryonea clarkiae]MDP8285182.1 transglycosylase SLT domain-containing protein [Candidatus Electryonea clarkiae]
MRANPVNMILDGMNRTPGKIPTNVDNPKLYEACQGFESYFVRYMIKNMRGSMNMMGAKTHGSEMYQGMFDNAISEEISKNNSMGLAEMLYKQVSRQNGTGAGQFPSLDFSGNTEERIDQYNKIINKAAEKYNLDPELIRAVIRQESGGKQFAISPKGAKGLMQIMDDTANDLGISNVYSPAQNIDGGSRYLSEQLDNFGDIRLALAAYNAGPQSVIKSNGVPQFTETKEYISKVMHNYKEYKSQNHSLKQTLVSDRKK